MTVVSLTGKPSGSDERRETMIEVLQTALDAVKSGTVSGVAIAYSRFDGTHGTLWAMEGHGAATTGAVAFMLHEICATALP